MRHHKTFVFVFSLVLLFSLNGLSQIQQENAPFSYFGPGDLKDDNIALNRSLGGVGNAYSSALHVNLKNPAALGLLRYATLHTGLFGNAYFLSNDQSTSDEAFRNSSFNTSMEYLVLGVPVTKFWGTAFGLRPFARTSCIGPMVFLRNLKKKALEKTTSC